MRYLISDIHGCYKEYRELLDKISFSEKDRLYVLGDAMDRGPEPVRVIQDIMTRSNVTYIIGNHDYEFYYFVGKLIMNGTGGNLRDKLTDDEISAMVDWMEDGGRITIRQFAELSRKEGQDILRYLSDSSVYEVLEDKGKKFILVHAGIDNFSEDKELEEYDFFDFISSRPDYTKRYYQGESVYVVTGHTPVSFIREDRLPQVYQGNGHIAIDCGCVFGGQLAAYCVESGDISYVKSKKCEKSEKQI